MALRRPLVAALFRTELRMLLRDRRTIVMSILVPLAVMPLVLFGSHVMNQRRERALAETVYEYAVTGPRAADARAVLADARKRALAAGETFRFQEAAAADPARALAGGTIHFYLDAETVAEARAGAPPAGSSAEPLAALPPDVPAITVVFRGNRDDSAEGARRVRRLLADARRERRGAALAARGFPVAAADLAAVVPVDLATAGQVAGLALGRLLTPLLMMFLLTGAAVVAIDSLAGEKERGTLETLLTTAVARAEIVAAKHLLVLAVALIITVIQIVNLLVYVGFHLIPTTVNFSAAVSPATALLLLVLYLPVAALVSSVLLLVSGHARSYKEAQLYFFPVFLVGMLPGLAAVLPALPLRSAIVVVPIANISVAVKDLLIGHADWPFTAVAWLTTAGAALWTSRLSAKGLSTERLIVPAAAEAGELAGGPALFPRHVLRWFAVMWAVLLVLGLNFDTAVDIRVQTAVNLIGIFLGGSFLMIRRYRLDVREALALRPVKPAVWVAVVAGVPAGLLTGIGVFRLAGLVVPVPPTVIEAFSEALVPASVPTWQILLLFTILPGICEEIAFRGMLLHGLHRRLHPAALALAVGVIFGLFHVTLFRIAPTAYLGVVLASVVLLTGSIFPAMLWHALHNGLGVLAGQYGWSLSAAEPGTYAAATAVLAACFWIIWRNRTPYPGLRPWRRAAGVERGTPA